MPDRFLQAEPLVAMIESERPTYAAAVPSVWIPVLELADRTTPDLSSLREVVIGGSACPPVADRGVRAAARRPRPARVGHDRDLAAGLGRAPAGLRAPTATRRGRTASPRAGCRPRSRAGSSATTARSLPSDGEAVGELEVRGPWVTGSYLGDDGARRRSTTAGCAPATSARSRADGYLTLTDRTKDVIKSGGEWISSVALENALMAAPGGRARPR